MSGEYTNFDDFMEGFDDLPDVDGEMDDHMMESSFYGDKGEEKKKETRVNRSDDLSL
jgi:hypothetical protein